MTVATAPPVHVRERSWNAPTWVMHTQKGRKVIFFRITRVPMQTRQLELRPQPLVAHNYPSVLTCQRPKLGPNSATLQRHLRQHHVLPTRRPPRLHSRLILQNLNEALLRPYQGFVTEIERVERDTRRRQQSKHIVRRVVEEGVGEEAARRRDESGCESLSGFGRWDDSVGEHALKR